MALETLKNVKKIGGFEVMREEEKYQFLDSNGCIDWNAIDEARKKFPVFITDEKNIISFKIQDGPIKENGVNGCQVLTIIETAKVIIEGLNSKFPCVENEDTISYLQKAIDRQNDRTKDRIERNVEGYDKN